MYLKRNFIPKVILILFLIIHFGFSINSSIAYSAIIYVGAQETYKTLQAGIDASSDYDTVIVKDGIYAGYNKLNGKKITVRSENGSENCVIEGRVIFENGEMRDTILDGFTIRNSGRSLPNVIKCERSSPTIKNCTFENNWIGIYNFQAQTLIKDCYFYKNVGNEGAAIANWNSDPIIDNCVFMENYNKGIGSSSTIYNINSNPEIKYCYFENNFSTYSNFWLISNDSSSSPKIDHCTFINNHGFAIANTDGSVPKVSHCDFINNGIYNLLQGEKPPAEFRNCNFYGTNMGNQSYSPIVDNCNFMSNGVENWFGMTNSNGSRPLINKCTFDGENISGSQGVKSSLGGFPTIVESSFRNHKNSAIYIDNSGADDTFYVMSSKFENNSGTNGGAIYNESNKILIESSYFYNNFASENGGAVYNNNSVVKIANSVFDKNEAIQYGGAVAFFYFWNPKVINCTFYNNSSQNGGSLYNDQYNTPVIANTISWGSTPNEIDYERDGFINLPLVSSSNIQGNFTGEQNINEDPRFIYRENDSIKLSFDSPCIDRGSNDISELPINDMDNQPRIIDGNADMIAVTDIGAYELGEICEGDFNNDLIIDDSDLIIFTQYFGKITSVSENIALSDFDHDRDVDGNDIFVLSIDFNRIDCPVYILHQ